MKKFYNKFFVISLCFSGMLFFSSIKISGMGLKRKGFNLLLITVDTLRPDRLSCYSKEHLKTPNIDQLAGKGVLFTRAFAHTPMTLPSHTNILLGTLPVYHGVHDNSNFIVEDEFLTLAEYLKSKGYSTGAFVGAFPLDSRFGLTQGFDVYDDNYGSKSNQEISYVERKAEIVVEKALEWLDKQKNSWFIWIHTFDPHQRYAPPEPFKTEYQNNPYNGEVAYVDYCFGDFFSYLKQHELYENTIIIFTADHGESLGQHGESTHGYFAYNSTIWVPLILYYPGIASKVSKIEQNVSHIDIFPTVCDILGIEKPSFLQGLSLLPAIKGKKLHKREIYFESEYPYYSRGWAPLSGYISGNHKFIDSPIPEFYDLERDFDELENLASSRKLEKYKNNLKILIKRQSFDGSAKKKKISREAVKKLQSLGYVSTPQASRKKTFSTKDDLKSLLPYQNKLMKAMGAYHKGNIEEGKSLLKEIISERPDFDLAYSYLATLYKEQKKLDKSVEILKEGFENNPSSYKIISTYGIFLVEANRPDEAIEILKKALTLMDYDPELWNYLGVAYWSKGDFQNAHQAYQKVLSLDNNYPIVFNNLGSLYLSQCIKTRKSEYLRKAVYHFKKAIEFDPGYASAYNGLGNAYRIMGDIDAAIFCWEKSVELMPDFKFALFNLGLGYLMKQERIKALEYLEKYKKNYYSSLPMKERNNLDSLIQKCKQE